MKDFLIMMGLIITLFSLGGAAKLMYSNTRDVEVWLDKDTGREYLIRGSAITPRLSKLDAQTCN